MILDDIVERTRARLAAAPLDREELLGRAALAAREHEPHAFSRALAQNVTVEEPLGGLPNFSIRFVWLNDPDGVTNYFAPQGPRTAAAGQ